MKTLNVNRNITTISLTAAATLGPDTDQVVANATSAGFTITLCDFNDGADHQVEIIISSADSSGNTVSISGNNGAFTASLSSSGTSSAIFQTQADGTWFIAGDVSTVSAGAANSRAISAGLATSTTGSTATSQNTSQSLNVSSTSSGVTSQSLIVSQTGSTATSQNGSQSLNVSSAQSGVASNSINISSTNSAVASQSIVLSTTTSTANSG